jgi:hypothetical protein
MLYLSTKELVSQLYNRRYLYKIPSLNKEKKNKIRELINNIKELNDEKIQKYKE